MTNSENNGQDGRRKDGWWNKVMPYRGDGPRDTPSLAPDFSYIKKLPGGLVILQLGCSLLGFLLGFLGSLLWRVSSGHGVYIFLSFLACLSCAFLLALRVFHLHTVFCRDLTPNWNILSLVHSGVNCFLMMVASIVMVEVSSGARMLRAAGVFGFLGFTMFLGQLAWEVVTFRKTRGLGGDHLPEFASATVVRGMERPVSEESQAGNSTPGEVVRGAVAFGDEELGANQAVGFIGIKQRPASFFLPPEQNGVSSPMLYAPGFPEGEEEVEKRKKREEEKGDGGRPRKSEEDATDNMLISI